jgi:hypothetical protein
MRIITEMANTNRNTAQQAVPFTSAAVRQPNPDNLTFQRAASMCEGIRILVTTVNPALLA